MAGALHHRGPDEFGVYRDARAGLCHARLSIIDLATGQQPLANEDETLWVVFNGEIFNYVELRAELAALGHRFRTRSDTEVIVHAFEAWGERAFARFNGQFALALWDARAEALVLARDRSACARSTSASTRGASYFGERGQGRSSPPTRASRAASIRWASTRPSPSGRPWRPQHVFAGVTEVPPGHVRVYAGGRGPRSAPSTRLAIPRRRMNGEPFRGSLEDAVVAVREALDAGHRAAHAPRRRAGGQLPLRRARQLARRRARAAGQGRAASPRSPSASPTPSTTRPSSSALMAAHIGSDHREVVVSRADIARVFPEVVEHTERPILRTAPAPLFLLSKLVRDAGIKVVLTGEGADEMFAGYDLFREGKVRRCWARQPASDVPPPPPRAALPVPRRDPPSPSAP